MRTWPPVRGAQRRNQFGRPRVSSEEQAAFRPNFLRKLGPAMLATKGSLAARRRTVAAGVAGSFRP